MIYDGGNANDFPQSLSRLFVWLLARPQSYLRPVSRRKKISLRSPPFRMLLRLFAFVVAVHALPGIEMRNPASALGGDAVPAVGAMTQRYKVPLKPSLQFTAHWD